MAAGGRLIESTTWAVRGLVAVDAQKSKAAIDAGVNWLLVHEQENGGWRAPDGCGTECGETATAESDVSQTAAVVLALVAAGLADHEATRRGIDFLVGVQSSGELDQVAWSVLALARWAVAIEAQAPVDQPTDLRLVCSDSL
jgi:squalene-hopene/tetraprenyl-beta-curcumene cyclase